MPDFPIVLPVAVLIALISAVLLMAAFGLSDRIIFSLQLAFITSAGAALWCAFFKHWLVEYSVWTMYLSGLALAVLMIRRFLPRKPPTPDHPKAEDTEADR